MKFLVSALMMLLTVACAGMAVPIAPGQVASHTVLDEKAAIGVELIYRLAAKMVTTAARSGLVGPHTAPKIAAADAKAYEAVLATRKAYEAANETDYVAATAKAQAAIADLVLLIR